MKLNVIFLACLFALSGCAFKEKGVGNKASAEASAVSTEGFSGQLSALLTPSIQSVTPNIVSIPSDHSGNINLQVIGTNLAYRGLPSQPTLITEKPISMSLGGTCSCANATITASVDSATNRDVLSCSIPIASCYLDGVINRTLTVTRAASSGDPQIVNSFGAVQTIPNMPFSLTGATITGQCQGSSTVQTGSNANPISCPSDGTTQIVISGATGFDGSGVLQVASRQCAISSQSSTGLTCTLPATCTGLNCQTQTLPIVYSQSGYSVQNWNFVSIGKFTITGVTPPMSAANIDGVFQFSGTNLSPNVIIKVGGKLCVLISNSANSYTCSLDLTSHPLPAGGYYATTSTTTSSTNITFVAGTVPATSVSNFKISLLTIGPVVNGAVTVSTLGGPISASAGAGIWGVDLTNSTITSQDGTVTCTSQASSTNTYNCNIDPICAINQSCADQDKAMVFTNSAGTAMIGTVHFVAPVAPSLIRVRKLNGGYEESRVLAADQGTNHQVIEIQGNHLSEVGWGTSYSVVDISGTQTALTCTGSNTLIYCVMPSWTPNIGNRAKMYSLWVLNTNAYRNVYLGNVFEVVPKNVAAAEDLSKKYCRSGMDCWVDANSNPFNFSDSNTRVWNRYLIILFEMFQ